MMNLSHLTHAIVAMIVQLSVALITGDWLAGATAGVALFIGREHAQAEHRYIAANGGKRYETPLPAEVGALLPASWSRDSVLDWVAPAVVVVATAIMMGV